MSNVGNKVGYGFNVILRWARLFSLCIYILLEKNPATKRKNMPTV